MIPVGGADPIHLIPQLPKYLDSLLRLALLQEDLGVQL